MARESDSTQRVLGVVAIHNHGPSAVYLGTDAGPHSEEVSVATGIPLPPGRSAVVVGADSAALWMVADADGQDVRVFEIAS